MTLSLYPIPHLGLGAVQELPVHPASASQNSPSAEAKQREVNATLSRQPDGTWQVATAAGVVGLIAPQDAAEYPEIELLFDAQLTPAVTLRQSPQPTVLLPRPGLCLPANNPPSSPWALLSFAPAISITDIPDEVDIPQFGRIHLLVTLRAAESDPQRISAYLGPQFIGTLDSYPDYLPDLLVQHAEQGLTTLAHAYHFPRQGGRVLNIYAGKQIEQETRDGSGQERLLAENTRCASSAAATFETTSFKAITDEDLSRIDRLPQKATADSTPTKKNNQSWLIFALVIVCIAVLIAVLLAL